MAQEPSNNTPRWVERVGSLGGWAYAIASFISTYTGLTIGAIVTVVGGYFAAAAGWLSQPAVYVPGLLFLFFLWTYIGIAVLRDRQTVKTVRIAHDYAYGIILDGGWKPTFGKFRPDDPHNPNADAISIRCQLRNTSQGPIKLMAEEFRVVIDGRTHPEGMVSTPLVWARLAHKSLTSPPVPWDKTKKHLTGSVVLKVLYGPFDGKYVRRYTLKLNIQIALSENSSFGQQSDEITEEADASYSE